jgi:vacuolar protein sorting-associated protein 16
MMEESGRLLLLQQSLEKDIDGTVTFVGLSVADTIMLCIKQGLSKRAEKIRSDWKVADKQ